MGTPSVDDANGLWTIEAPRGNVAGDSARRDAMRDDLHDSGTKDARFFVATAEIRTAMEYGGQANHGIPESLLAD